MSCCITLKPVFSRLADPAPVGVMLAKCGYKNLGTKKARVNLWPINPERDSR